MIGLAKSVFFLFLFCSSLVSQAVELRGDLTQGGMVIGHTSPDARVVYQNRELKVSPDGYFVLGFGRDAPLKSELNIRFANGFQEIEPINLKPRKYDEQRIDGLPKNTVEPNAEELKRIQVEQQLINAARARNDARTDFLSDFIWPVTGRLSGIFGSRRILNGQPKRPHVGVDIAVPEGTPVVAPADGVVTLVHSDMFYTGGTLFIQHGHGISTMYIHLSKILVREGQEVKQGEPIAEVGMTGRATGPHLHWGLNWFDTKMDPALLVPPMSEVLKNKGKE
ncbi:MAG: M23 family metallopeptidase [Gammaproteobacteria bacterium]|nr:M23 family metallopeptidase [Gammaproteobacteria bacterium]